MALPPPLPHLHTSESLKSGNPFRNTFPEQTRALPGLFEACKRTPDWALGQEAMIARLEELKHGTEIAGREDANEAWACLVRKAEGLE